MLFADVVRSINLDAEGMRSALAAHDEVLRSAIETRSASC